jgi:hypothetical protein
MGEVWTGETINIQNIIFWEFQKPVFVSEPEATWRDNYSVA